MLAGQDYEGVVDMQIHFPNGSEYVRISVNITDDDLTEGVEQFIGLLSVSNQADPTLSFNTSVIVEILDNDSTYKKDDV